MQRRQNNKGLVLYEQVLQKNFEIIQSFLNKFPVIFKRSFLRFNSKNSIEQILRDSGITRHQNETEKIREDLQINSTMLDKKLSALRQHSARNHRNSSRFSQQGKESDEKKSSIFRLSISSKDGTMSYPQTARERAELLGQVQKKQDQMGQKIQKALGELSSLKEKVNFLSVLTGKLSEGVDNLTETKADSIRFDQLAIDLTSRMDNQLSQMAEEKYQRGTRLIDQKVGMMQRTLGRYIQSNSDRLKNELQQSIERMASLSDFHNQIDLLKSVVERIVDESIDSFANKDQTKKVLSLFEKKFIRIDLFMSQLMEGRQIPEAGQNESKFNQLLFQAPKTPKQEIRLSRKEPKNEVLRAKENQLMGGFGRKRRIMIQKT